MKQKSSESTKKKNLQNALDNLVFQRKVPKSFFVLMLLIYAITFFLIPQISKSKANVTFQGAEIPMNAFAGVFSTLGNICVIMLAVFGRKHGFRTALIVLLPQFPILTMNIIRSHTYNSIPGLFSNFLTLIVIILIYVNNTKLDEVQKKIRMQAITDALTELPNRFASSELVNNLAKRGEKFTVVAIDLNNFKSVNDTMGFNAGNEVLKTVASRWQAIADGGLSGTLDFIARLNGDEFALVIRGYSQDEEVTATISQYETAIREKLTVDDCDFYVSASFGYAEYPTDSDNVDTVVSYANAAMSEVKRVRSSNHVLRFTPALLKEERTLEIEKKIRTALDNDAVICYLQPQYDMSKKLRGFEALARMKDEDGKLISPGEFIPVAEKVGLVDKIDLAVFQKAATFLGAILKKTNEQFLLSINVSVRHLMKNDFLDEIRTVLQNSGMPAELLEIEITESVMIESADKALQCINSLKDMGIKIAIDDFGTGYSALSYLNSFPANLLKIDKSFIDQMNESDSMKQYVAAIISMGHVMGFDVISEGVEKPQQIETLQTIGCDFIQGFIWGRPVPPEEAEKLVLP